MADREAPAIHAVSPYRPAEMFSKRSLRPLPFRFRGMVWGPTCRLLREFKPCTTLKRMLVQRLESKILAVPEHFAN